MLYSTVKPAIGGTTGRLNIDAQVFEGAEMTGAVGKMTTLIVLLGPQAPGPVAPATVVPQADVNAYCARTVWQPGVDGTTGVAEKAPPFILYTVVNPDEDRSVTVGKIKEPLQLFADGASTGAEGNMTD